MSSLAAIGGRPLSDTRGFEMMLMRNHRVTLKGWRKYVNNGKKKRKRMKNSAKSCKADSPTAHLKHVTVIL